MKRWIGRHEMECSRIQQTVMKKMAPAMKKNGRIPPGIQIRKIPKAMPLCEFYDMLSGRPWTGDLSEQEFRSTYDYGGRMGDMAFIYSVQKRLNSQHHCWQSKFVHTWYAYLPFPCPQHAGVWGSQCIDPLVLNLGTRWRRVTTSRPGNFTPEKEPWYS